MWMPGFCSCWYWNGGELKCAVISDGPDSSAVCASGCDIETVSAIELRVLALAERLLGGHLQRHRLDRHLDRRQRDPVLVGEVLDRLHVRIARVEVERHRVDRRHRLHVEIALGARPERDQRPDAARRELQAVRQQRVVHHVAAGELRPADLDVDARGLRVLLDQLLLLHQHQRQVADAVLLRDLDFGHLGAQRRAAGRARPTRAAATACASGSSAWRAILRGCVPRAPARWAARRRSCAV